MDSPIGKPQSTSGLNIAVILSGGASGLGATRSLAKCGVPVIVVTFSKNDVLNYSRYPLRKIVIESDSIEHQESQLLERLMSMQEPGLVLLASSDHMVDFMSRKRDRLNKKFLFKLPSPALIQALNDKQKETLFIESAGFAIPATVQELPATPDLLLDKLRLPIIFKPNLYTTSEQFPHKNVIAISRDELDEIYLEWGSILNLLLAQEVIPGPDSACWICSTTFDRDHNLLDCGIKQKLRSAPAHYGGSCYAISKNNDEIVSLARQLGKKIRYIGHAGIEFRWDERDSVYKYIELNPRFPANVEFDDSCDLNTVWNSYQLALGADEFATSGVQRQEVVFLDFWCDFFSQKSDGKSSFSAFVTDLKILLNASKGIFFSWKDPLPGIHYTYDIFRKTLMRKT